MLELWEKVREVPDTAKRQISGGRLNGKTDINPMWRIKTLTEQFGVCGVGWKYEIVSQRLESGANEEIAAFVNILLYVKSDGEWSEPIPGSGGSMFVAKERNGLFVSDECFKMALTDAISVACKALGFGADVYWDGDKTKYDRPTEKSEKPDQQPAQPKVLIKASDLIKCEVCGKVIPNYKMPDGHVMTAVEVSAQTKAEYNKGMCLECAKKAKSLK